MSMSRDINRTKMARKARMARKERQRQTDETRSLQGCSTYFGLYYLRYSSVVGLKLFCDELLYANEETVSGPASACKRERLRGSQV